MVDLKTEIEKMSREELETMASNVVRMNTYKFRDFSDKTICYVNTTADKLLLERVWNNLRELNPHVTVQRLVEELNDRDFYAAIVPIQDFLIMNF